jgi:VIT1/CCC1 family predicted Fe2+/Mn2+ transporter
MSLDPKLEKALRQSQEAEITEHLVYKKLASFVKDKKNSEVLRTISEDELRHFEFWKSLTAKEVKPDKLKIFFYVFISRIFGLTFGVKLMEKGEINAQGLYRKLSGIHPQVEAIVQDEADHEKSLLAIIDEERLQYVSSMVLGLNDALVELTGALTGLSLALQNTKLVAVVGLVTGLAASMSMAASAYLSEKQQDNGKNPLKASLYTGAAYVVTVLFLITPYLILDNIFLCLSLVMIDAIFIVFLFTFYISVAKDLDFKKRFIEMAGISLSVAVINFFIGILIRKVFGVDV